MSTPAPRPPPPTSKMSSKVRTALVVLVALATAMSMAMLGLTARHVSFIKNIFLDKRSTIDVVYQHWSNPNQQWERQTEAIGYLPAMWSMLDTKTVLAVSVLCTVLGAGIIFLDLWQRDTTMQTSVTGRKVRHITFVNLPTILVLNGLAVVVLAVGTGVSWNAYRETGLNYFYTPKDTNRYHWNFESWNCQLAPHIRPGLTSVTTPELNSLCKQATAARYMVLITFIISVIAFGLHFWAWRKHNIAVRQYQEAAPPYEQVAWKNADLESQSERSVENSPMSPVSPIAAPDHIAEISGQKRSRAELPNDATIKEMMGEFGHKEMEGGVVAAEKPTDEKV